MTELKVFLQRKQCLEILDLWGNRLFENTGSIRNGFLELKGFLETLAL